ncbi:MAG: NAD(P)/FAD-dependent oxidoreductase [Lachnospiraceae bacterium]
MKKRICIAGAGPAGLVLARELRLAGMGVTIFEAQTKEMFLLQHNWSDALELSILKDVKLPVPMINGTWFAGDGVKGEGGDEIYEPYRQAHLAVYAPDYSTKTSIDADFKFVLTDRRALCRYQLKQTIESGVKIQFGHKVTGLIGVIDGPLGKIAVKGAVIQSEEGNSEIATDLVVDATGQAASLRTMLSAQEIGQPFVSNQYGLVYRVIHKYKPVEKTQKRKTDADNPPFCNHYRLRTPDGYLFMHIHDHEHVDIGGGATSMEAAQKIVYDMIDAIPNITDEEVRGGCGRNLKCLPPDALAANGFLVVGHAAAMVNTVHGSGVSPSMAGALLAAQVIKKANDFSIDSLWEYSYRWLSNQGASYAALFERPKDLETEETVFLMEKGVINGEYLSNDYTGNYIPPTTNEERRWEEAYKENPKVMSKWIRAESNSKRKFDHYNRYPSKWDCYALESWIAGKSK